MGNALDDRDRREERGEHDGRREELEVAGDGPRRNTEEIDRYACLARSESDARAFAERLGLGADVADEERCDEQQQPTPKENVRRAEREGPEKRVIRPRTDLDGCDRERSVGEAVERRVEEGAEARATARRARDLPVQRVAERAEEQHQQSRARLSEREQRRAGDGYEKAHHRDGVGSDAEAMESPGDRRDAAPCRLCEAVREDAHETRFMSARKPRSCICVKCSRSNEQRTSRPTRSVRTMPARVSRRRCQDMSGALIRKRRTSSETGNSPSVARICTTRRRVTSPSARWNAFSSRR